MNAAAEDRTTARGAEVDARNREDADGYGALEALIRDRLTLLKGAGPLFLTDAADLFDTFLANLPPEVRQHYNCNCCRRFVNGYGPLVWIEPDGTTTSALWSFGPPVLPVTFGPAVHAMMRAVETAKVVGAFVSAEKTWGTPVNEPGPGSKYHGKVRWTHLSGPNPDPWTGKARTAGQRIAELCEDHGVLCRALDEYPLDVAREAARVLDAEVLPGAEKAVECARWYVRLRESLDATPNNRRRANLLWRAVATAPPGWCHLKNNIVSQLMDGVKEGLDFPALKRRWAGLVNPLTYRRPQFVSTGQLDAAERLVERLGVARSLERRYARLTDVVTPLWLPVAEPETPAGGGAGVFDKVRPAARDARPAVRPVALPAAKPTSWERFSFDVLPTARRVELLTPTSRANFHALVTAAHPEASPVVQWDGLRKLDAPTPRDGCATPTLCDGCGEGCGGRELPRNPVTWWMVTGGSYAHEWGLGGGRWVPVTCVSLAPPHWQRPDLFAQHDQRVLFALEGCRPTAPAVLDLRGGGLFPNHLRAELHEARAAVEAHSNATRAGDLPGLAEADACGLMFCRGQYPWDLTLRVTDADGVVREHRVDRWD